MKTAIAKPAALTHEEKENVSWMINAGQDDTIRRLRDMKGTPRDVLMLEKAIATEKAGQNRSSRLKPMEASLRKFSKTLAPLALTGESKPPDWTRARTILAGIKTCLRLSLAGQVLLGMELLAIKTELGFVGRKRRGPSLEPNDSVLKCLNRTWENWCKAELGISPDGADNFIACYEAAKVRVKKLGGDKQLAGLLETHPAKLTEESHKILSGMVDKLVWGETQKSLLEELRLVKFQATLTGGDTTKDKTKGTLTVEQGTFAFFSPIPATIAKLDKAIANIRVAPDFQGYLHALPLNSASPDQVSLSSLKAMIAGLLSGDLSKTLGDIDAAIAAKSKSSAA